MALVISKIIHRDESKLKLEFAYDQVKIGLIKQIEGYSWSKTHKAWLLPENNNSIEKLKELFNSEELVFEGYNVSPSQNFNTETESNPVIKNVNVEVINRKILIRLPKNEEDIKFIRTLRYFRWLKAERMWEVPDYPGNLDLIRDYFKERLSEIKVHESIEVKNGNNTTHIINNDEVLMIKLRSGRVKIIAAFNRQIISIIKEIPYNRWDTKNKWWTIPFSDEFIAKLNSVCEAQQLKVIFEEEPVGISGVKRISPYDVPNYRRAPESYVNKHIEVRNSPHTIKSYVSAFEEFINYFYSTDIDEITEPQILEYLRYLVTERKISVSSQNVAINAIKFYFEQVLKGRRKFYFIDRPRKDIILPDVLNIEEITAMIKAADNIKHKLIIMFAYSSGLRLGEVVRLRLTDIDRQRMQVRVEQGKGRKDRYTKLSEKILPVLDAYIKEYNPEDLIFNGEKGKAYSTRSVQEVVRNMAKKAGIAQKVTPKTLRHTFATHSLENGIDLRYIQSMMGHSSSKTTEIYTHITTKGFENIKSPMDGLDI
jgi:site-specific recombinase XerD